MILNVDGIALINPREIIVVKLVSVKYAWISTLKASSKGEVALTNLYTQQPGNISNVRLQTHFNTHPHAKRGPRSNAHITSS
jgi:hypothetical protein